MDLKKLTAEEIMSLSMEQINDKYPQYTHALGQLHYQKFALELDIEELNQILKLMNNKAYELKQKQQAEAPQAPQAVDAQGQPVQVEEVK